MATGARTRNPSEAPNRILHDLVAIVQVWYTDSSDKGRLRLPLRDPERLLPYNHVEFDRIVGSRTRRGGYLITQFRYLLCHDEVARGLRDDPELLSKLIPMFSCFVGLTTQHQALGVHIKFETEYARCFALLSDISHLSRDVGACFLRFPKPGPIAVAAPFNEMKQIVRRICADAQLDTEVLDRNRYKAPAMHDLEGVLLGRSVVTTFDLQIFGISAFSFHHYLHYLLGEMTKTLFTLPNDGSESLRSLLRRHVFDHNELDQDIHILLVIDQVLTSE